MRTTLCSCLLVGSLAACNPPSVRGPAPRITAGGAPWPSTESPISAPAPASEPEAAVPAPHEMAADVLVSGLTSTARRIDVRQVGRHVPRTYAGERIGNSPGFTWWVSRHFALKTDRTQAHARLYLELLELAYPHYVEAFGDEPPGIEHTRIPLVYASSWNQAREAMLDDGILRGPSGGGETMYFNKVGYSFPSFYEEHQRYIVVHEAAHGFQMCLTGESRLMPTWFVEGIADSLAHHVYDPRAHRLTVMVFDRGPKDYMAVGLREYAKAGRPGIRDINRSTTLRRGLNFLLIHYLVDDPSRAARFVAWRDELLARRLHGEAMRDVSESLLGELYGPWDALERDFAAWVDDLDKTFTVSGEGWEQDGDGFWVRDRGAERSKVPRRIDLALVPGTEPRHDPRRLDYPAHGPSPLVPGVARGVETPSVGFLVRYVEDRIERGELGIGLGREGDDLVSVIVEGGRLLVVDPGRAGGEPWRLGLPAPMVDGLHASEAAELGVRITLAATTLEIEARVRDLPTARFSVPLGPDQRERLVTRPISILAGGADHRIVPFVDDGRPSPTLYEAAAPPNRWRDSRAPAAARLARALWTIGAEAPPTIEDALVGLTAAAVEGASSAHVSPLIVEAVAAADDDKGTALTKLAGLSLRQERGVDGALVVRLRNRGDHLVTGNLEVRRGEEMAARHPVSVPAGRTKLVRARLGGDQDVHVVARLIWRAHAIQLEAGPPVLDDPGLELAAEVLREDGEAVASVRLGGPLAEEAEGTLRVQAMTDPAVAVERAVKLGPGRAHVATESLDLPPGTPVRVIAELEADGEPIRIETVAVAP